MSSDSPLAGIPAELLNNGNHTDLIAQLAEEVGFLSGVLTTLDVKSDRLEAILATALDRWSQLAAIRREVNGLKRDEAGVLR